MSDLLFDSVASDYLARERETARAPEVCPECGLMSEYVERFACGRFMASHGSWPKVMRGISVKAARICHGFERR